MKRGFVSIFFLVIVGLLVVALHQPIHAYPEETDSVLLLTSKRTELENRMDAVIQGELRRGLILQETPEMVRGAISQGIMDEIHAFMAENPSIAMEEGIVPLTVNEYSSLAFTPIEKPITAESLYQNSLVIIWPADEHSRYGEYIYTGGVLGGGGGNRVPIVKMQVNKNRSLFAIPIRYKSCAWNILPDTTCIIVAEGHA